MIETDRLISAAPASVQEEVIERALRPKALSVTRIERLIRDPYAIYARFILQLEPVKPVSSMPDPARRGTIFHAAIGDFGEFIGTEEDAILRVELIAEELAEAHRDTVQHLFQHTHCWIQLAGFDL